VDRAELADLRVVNTCSVTTQAAGKSRQAARGVVRLPVLRDSSATHDSSSDSPADVMSITDGRRTIVTGCWATSDKGEAEAIPGVSAVLTHHDDVAGELDRLLRTWQTEDRNPPTNQDGLTPRTTDTRAGGRGLAVNDGWMISANADALSRDVHNRTPDVRKSKKNPGSGTTKLPLLGERQAAHTRAFLKVQDGCDAHCTYCIIPDLRPRLWSKPVDDLVEEARRMVEAGHVEVVLTGIFLGAYGQSTALRRRQPVGAKPIAGAVEALCTRVPGLRRVRLSSLEPGDLEGELLDVLAAHEQVVPHFHLPLQSGSNEMLRRMNRHTRGWITCGGSTRCMGASTGRRSRPTSSLGFRERLKRTSSGRWRWPRRRGSSMYTRSRSRRGRRRRRRGGRGISCAGRW
jgi:tRNA A37 methylthiotransferase MiaB